MDRVDVLRYADRVTSRCHTVEVPLKIERDEVQEESLHVVSHFYLIYILLLPVTRLYLQNCNFPFKLHLF